MEDKEYRYIAKATVYGNNDTHSVLLCREKLQGALMEATGVRARDIVRVGWRRWQRRQWQELEML